MSEDDKRSDEDWKAQMQREREKIAAEAEGRAAEGGEGDEGGGPPPDTASLVPIFEQLASQAMSGLGQYPDPRTGARGVDLDMAKYAIDLLSSLEAKTKGRLGTEEKSVLGEFLGALQSGFAQVQQQIAQAAMREDPPGGGAAGPQG